MNNNFKELLHRLFSLRNVVPLLTIFGAFIGTIVAAPFGLQREQLLLGLMAFLAIDALIERLELLSSMEKDIKVIKDAESQLHLKLNALQQQVHGTKHVSDLLLHGYPDLSQELAAAKRVSILATTLAGTATRYRGQFAEVLSRGGALRFLVSDTTPEVIATLAFRSAHTRKAEVLVKTIETNTALIKELADETSNSAAVQIRRVACVAPFSMILVDRKDGTSRIYVKFLSFRNYDGKHPSIEIKNEVDNEWFMFFSEQFENLWNACENAQ